MAEDLALRERVKRLLAQFDSYIGSIFGRLALLEEIFNVRIHPGITLADFRTTDMSAYAGAVVQIDAAGENGYFKRVVGSYPDDGRNYINDLNSVSYQRVSML